MEMFQTIHIQVQGHRELKFLNMFVKVKFYEYNIKNIMCVSYR